MKKPLLVVYPDVHREVRIRAAKEGKQIIVVTDAILRKALGLKKG